MSAPDVTAEARRWLRYARDDLYLAGLALRDSGAAPHSACYSAQQAAEKAIKAVLVLNQIDFPRTHDLDLLRDLVPDGWSVRTEAGALRSLAEWAVDARYPGDWPEPTSEDAVRAVVQARAVLAAVERDLADHAFAAPGEGGPLAPR